MKTYNAIMHAVYAIAVVGVIVFVAAGVVPDNLDEFPLEFEIGTDSEYPVTDSADLFRDNIRSALNENNVDYTVQVVQKSNSALIHEITPSNQESDIDDSITEIENLALIDEDAIVVLKGADNKTLVQSMIMKESDEMSISIFTEIRIRNELRYDLMDIDLGISLLNDKGTVDYKILEGAPTTIKAGKSAALPVSLKVNMLNAMLTVMSGSDDSLDLILGIEISGKYFYGLAGASVYAEVNIDVFEGMPAISMTKTVTENRIEIKMDEKLDDFPIDLPEEINITVGDVDITIKNDDTDGLSLVAETDGTKTIVEALKEKYDSGDYGIEIEVEGTTETLELDKDSFAQLIEIMEAFMEAFT